MGCTEVILSCLVDLGWVVSGLVVLGFVMWSQFGLRCVWFWLGCPVLGCLGCLGWVGVTKSASSRVVFWCAVPFHFQSVPFGHFPVCILEANHALLSVAHAVSAEFVVGWKRIVPGSRGRCPPPPRVHSPLPGSTPPSSDGSAQRLRTRTRCGKLTADCRANVSAERSTCAGLIERASLLSLGGEERRGEGRGGEVR